jgi:hypothetical protein
MRAGKNKLNRYGKFEVEISGSPKKTIVAGSPVIVRIKVEVGLRRIRPGGGIRLEIPVAWSEPQTRDPQSPGYIRVFSAARATLVWEVVRRRYLHVIVSSGSLLPGERVEILYGEEGKALCRPMVLGGCDEFKVTIDSDGRKTFYPLHGNGRVSILPGPPQLLRVVLPTVSSIGEKIYLKVGLLDSWGNPLDFNPRRLHLSPQRFLKGFSFLKKEGKAAVFTARCARTGRVRLKIAEKKRGIHGISNPLLIGETEDHIYWGDLHGHSRYSDGAGTADEYYTYVRGPGMLDFAALADHDSEVSHLWFEEDLLFSETQWAEARKKARAYTREGLFVAFCSYEWAGRPYGDKNVLYPGWDGKIYRHREKRADTPQKLYRLLRGREALVIPHSLSSDFMGNDWDLHDRDLERLCEIYSMHGASEFHGNPFPVLGAIQGHSFQDALARGYRLGVTAGGDHHNSQSGNERITRGPYPSLRYRGGFTAVWSRSLRRQQLYQALKNRHCYATTGERFFMSFTLNGAPMGSEIRDKSDKRRLQVRVEAGSAIKDLVIIKNNQDFYRASSPRGSARVELLDDSGGDDFYYLRVTLSNGTQGWSSPIWVNARDKKGSICKRTKG